MRHAVVVVACLATAAALAPPAGPTWATGPATGRYIIAGEEAECRANGIAVPLVRVGNLGDAGRIWFLNRAPVIAIDPVIMDKLPDKLQRFFYDHECAHLVLGHHVTFSLDRESEADCWAVTRGRDRGRLTRDEVVSFAPFLASSPGSPWGHLPGPQRARHLLQCYDHPTGG